MKFIALDIFNKIKLRFDGITFKDEPSSEFPHAYVLSLGSYKGSPFVTGHASTTNGVKTEILDYLSGQWQRAASYPFSNENRYLSKKVSIVLYLGWVVP